MASHYSAYKTNLFFHFIDTLFHNASISSSELVWMDLSFWFAFTGGCASFFKCQTKIPYAMKMQYLSANRMDG